MYNVIIVEDDAIVRMYLRSLIDWQKHNLNLVAELENGMIAKEYIENNQVDIVITDVSMPVMNGIELIKYINGKENPVKIIVLSCYTDYEFIREALKCGVCDYIIKQQLTKEALISLLEKITDSLKKERESIKIKNEVYNIFKSNLIKNIINKVIENEDEAAEYLSQFCFRFRKSRYLIVIFKIDNYVKLQENIEKSELNNYYSCVIKTIEQFVNDKFYGIVEKTQNNELTLLLNFDYEAEINDIFKRVHESINDISIYVKSRFPFTVSIAVSNTCNNFSEIPRAYKSTQSMLESYMFFNKSNILLLKNQNNGYNNILTLEDEKNFINIVIEGDIDKAIDLTNKYIQKFESSHLVINNFIACIMDFLNIITRVAIKCEININTLFEVDHIPYEEIESKHDIEEIKNWVISIINKIIALNSEKDTSHRTDILKVIDYIENHYNDEISLQDVSRFVNISSNYFSMIFKKEIGVSFSEYLLNVRLEKSKLLLKKNNIKIYEVADKSGFGNNQYFNRVFKKKYGITPLEYKKRVTGRADI